MKDMVFYQAPGARTGDVIPKYIDGAYQLFYLKNWKDKNHPDFVPGWHRMESRDLVRMSGETPIHVLGGTGDLVFHEGKWHLFACIFPDGKQLVTHYVSTRCHKSRIKALPLGELSAKLTERAVESLILLGSWEK